MSVPTGLVVAYVSALGYLRCTDHEGPDAEGMRALGMYPVYVDNSAFHGDKCDTCGKVVAQDRRAEMRTEFGAGETVVDVVTGESIAV